MYDTSGFQQPIGISLNYSLDQQDTGQKWIDGKQIYCKTIKLSALPNKTKLYHPHDIENIGTVVYCYGMYKDPSTGIVMKDAHTTTSAYCSTYITPTDIVVETNSQRSSYTENYLTVLYTLSDK